jgi:hypothetical protein
MPVTIAAAVTYALEVDSSAGVRDGQRAGGVSRGASLRDTRRAEDPDEQRPADRRE